MPPHVYDATRLWLSKSVTQPILVKVIFTFHGIFPKKHLNFEIQVYSIKPDIMPLIK